MRQVSWTPIRFLWALSFPGFLFVLASILVGEDPGSVESFRKRYFDRRVPFFSLVLATAIASAFGPWIFGLLPWLDLAPVHPVAAVVATLSVAGLGFKSHNVHAILVSLGLLLAAAQFVFMPLSAPAAG